MNKWSPKDMLEITLNEPDDFLKVKETLTRMGIASSYENKLYQSCHILHKQGHYMICHFKELFLLDGKSANLEENDIKRRNTIGMLLYNWGLCGIINPPKNDNMVPAHQIKIIKYSDKKNWNLIPKYKIGND